MAQKHPNLVLITAATIGVAGVTLTTAIKAMEPEPQPSVIIIPAPSYSKATGGPAINWGGAVKER